MGAVAMLTGESTLVAVGVIFLAALCVVARARERTEDPGVTTEIALVLTYLIGVLCILSLPLAAAVAVGQTGILFARERLHAFANNWLRPAEVRDGILLAALALIALPLMPDRPFWGQMLNPHLITQLLTLLLFIQALAHLSRRLLDARQAVALSAIASGFVSSTATVASMGICRARGQIRCQADGGCRAAVLRRHLAAGPAGGPGGAARLVAPVDPARAGGGGGSRWPGAGGWSGGHRPTVLMPPPQRATARRPLPRRMPTACSACAMRPWWPAC